MAVVVMAGIGVGSASAQASDQRVPFTPPLEGSPSLAFGAVAAPPRDRVIEGEVPATSELEKAAAATRIPDGDGHSINLRVSNGYLPSPEANQGLADFFGSLLHGDEMDRLNVYVATPSEMPKLCGADSTACYYSDKDKLIIVGEANFGGFPTPYVTAHEYGHHVANYRRNSPWPAIDMGTKRWATYENVCHYSSIGKYFPGNEGKHYFANPGEAFAEAYARYDSRYRASHWDWNTGLEPDAGSYDSIEKDVLDPWKGNTSTEYSGNLPAGRSMTRAFDTPLDGNLTVRLSGPRSADFDLYLRSRNGRVLRQSRSRGSNETVRFNICGQSKLRFTAYSDGGSGNARITVSKP